MPQLGNINIRKHRETERTIKTCSILIKNSKYYAAFSCEVESKPLPKIEKKIGIDLGLTSFLTTSDSDLKKALKSYKKA